MRGLVIARAGAAPRTAHVQYGGGEDDVGIVIREFDILPAGNVATEEHLLPGLPAVGGAEVRGQGSG